MDGGGLARHKKVNDSARAVGRRGQKDFLWMDELLWN